MKKIAYVVLLLVGFRSFAVAQRSNAVDFPVKVHIVFSRAVSVVGGFPGGPSYQQIEAVIDGQRVELTGSSNGVLALGDYPARISTKVHGPKNPNDYDIYKGYDFLMSDGKVRTYQVSAMGQPEFPAPPPPMPPASSDATPAPAPTPPPAVPSPSPMA